MNVTDALVLVAAKLVVENQKLSEKVVELTEEKEHLDKVLYAEGIE